MIKTESEYQEAAGRLDAEARRIEEHAARLAAEGLKGRALQRALDPLRSFHLQLEEEVRAYERLKRGQLDELTNLRGLGTLLVGLRIARNVSQTELAGRLGVHPSQVSRDERNEYHGMTVERASRVLEALGVELHSALTAPVLAEDQESASDLAS